MNPDPTLYHYTCTDHGAPGIERTGLVYPGAHLQQQHPSPSTRAAAFAWLTDLDTPERAPLGLTSKYLTCDRTERRYTIHPADVATHVLPWMDVRNELPWQLVQALEGAPGAMPRHWFVANQPVRVATP